MIQADNSFFFFFFFFFFFSSSSIPLIIACRNQVEKRVIIENFDALVLTVDEMLDGG